MCCRWEIPSLQQSQFVPSSPEGKKKISAGSAGPAGSVTHPLLSPASQVPLGISVAASVRVGNALGAGNVEQAKTSCITALLCTGQCSPAEQNKGTLSANASVSLLQGWGPPIGTQSHLFEPSGQGKILIHLFCYEPGAKALIL